MIKLIVYGVVMAAAYCGACYASDLWMGKSGFWWGVAAAVLFDFCISLISGASKNAWDSLVKEASSASIGGKLFNILCAGVAARTAERLSRLLYPLQQDLQLGH